MHSIAHERTRLALMLKPAIEEKAEERMRAGKADPMQKSAQGSTRQEVAKLAGVSHDTVSRVEVIEKEAKEQQGTRTDLSQKSDEGGPAAILHVGGRNYVEDIKGRTDEKLAKIAGVSRDTVRKVEIIEREATEEVKQAARKGEMKAFSPLIPFIFEHYPKI